MSLEFLELELWGNPVRAYGYFLGVVLVSMIVAQISRRIVMVYLLRWAAKTESKWDDVIIQEIMGPAVWLVVIGGAAVGKEVLTLSKRGELWVDRCLVLGVVVVFFVAAYRFFRGAAGIVADGYLSKATENLDPAEKAIAVRTAERIRKQITEIAGMVLSLLALLTVLSNVGIDLKAIWASLGIGGIVLAMAVKDPLANIIGRMYIYSTGLFDEGHPIEVDKWNGTVTKIGFFRTALEIASDLSTVTIPNSTFISQPVKNKFGRTKFVFKWDLDIPYNVPPETLELLESRLRDLVMKKPEIIKDQSFVYIDRLDKYSKVVRVWFQARLPDWPASTRYGSVVLIEIQKLFAEMGVDFAYPTYAVQVEPDKAKAVVVPPEE